MTKLKGFKKLKKKKERPALAKKKSQVEKLSETVAKAKTIALLDVRNLPDRLLQSARKKLRGKAEFIMAKNTVLKRALEKSKNGKKLLELIKSPSVVILSNELSPYKIFKHFKDNKQKVAAKPGQIAPFDIIVPAGETDLPPGPALSELKGAKINATIKGGKIAVAKDSTVAKEGEKINDLVCKGLQKLNILPFEAQVKMVAGVEEGYVYGAEILDIDEKGLANDLKASLQDAYNMSINCAYPTLQNIGQMLASALVQSRALVQEAGVYSTTHMELLLTRAVRMQNALDEKVGKAAESPKEGGETPNEKGAKKEEGAPTPEGKGKEKKENPAEGEKKAEEEKK
ncbi:MAG: 50S ribosomal protein L10 [Candidatus Micrarchaeota archaeon]